MSRREPRSVAAVGAGRRVHAPPRRPRRARSRRSGAVLHARGARRLLPRALSLCLAPPGELAFLLDAVGPGTEALCALRPGDRVHVFGPLGNGFRLDVERPLLVGGGIGMAPLPYLAEALPDAPVVLGFRTERHAEAAALLPRAEVVVDPVLVTELHRARVRRARVRARADAARGRRPLPRRPARVGGADGLRVRRVLRLRGRDRRRAQALMRGGSGSCGCLTPPAASTR